MDERSPRQPDSSGPPEESGDTPTRGVRPENPYRIPQRPPASGGAAASGASDRPESWDTPYPAAQGPTGEWTPLRPEESPPTDTWKDWESPTEDPGPAPEGGRGAHSAPEQTAAAWHTPEGGNDAPAWGEQPPGAHRNTTPATDGTPAWGDDRNDSWNSVSSGPQPTAAWDDRPGGTPAADDAWGSDDRGDSWDTTAGDPQQTAAAWHTPEDADDAPAWGEQPPGAHRNTTPATDGTPAWGDDRNDSWNSVSSGPQPTGAAWDTGDPTPEQTTAPWGEQPGDTRGPADAPNGSWGPQPDDARRGTDADGWNAHSGPQPTGAAWGATDRADDAPAWGGDQARSWGGGAGDPQQTAAAWSGAGNADDAPAWGEQPQGAGDARDGVGGPGPAGPGYQDEWSGPQQGAGAWDSGDGRGGPPPGPGGPRDDWDDWDGAPQDGEPAPRGDGFEYLYNGNAPAPPEQPDPPARKSRRGLIIGLVSAFVVLALIGGGVSWYVLTLPRPEEATAEYAAAWEAQDYERLAAVTTGGDPAEVLGGIASGIGVESVDVTVGEPATDGGAGTASYEVAVGLSNAGDWGWEGELPLVRQDGEWRVDFSPEVAFPGLTEGMTLTRTAVWGERGQILAADGTRLDTPDISGSLQMIVGGMGEATEEDVERLGPAYRVGDTVGTTGLQRTYEERLAGQAATTIVMVDAGTEADSVEVTEDNTVATLDGAPGENVVTSIDMAVQNAAAGAIIDSAEPAGMVAIRPSTGEILAAVNVPGGFNRAFEGRYPPGSTFKVVSYNALLDGGMTMDSPFQCPKEYNPGGWEFTNAGGAEYGSQTMTQAFATSCNTALVQAAVDNIDANALLTSAELFGMNAPMDIGVPTFEPVYPISEGSVMLGAQSIGQGQVETSPLHMATVPAAVADGTWRPPLLVTEPAAGDLPEPRPIANAEALRTMMRAVVTEGTAENLPFQGEVYGKTGTAEFGTAEEGEELPSHAWMIGFKGDVAFAVVVEGGGGGSSVAGPIAAKFTNAL